VLSVVKDASSELVKMDQSLEVASEKSITCVIFLLELLLGMPLA
jgi:hypothetical protein